MTGTVRIPIAPGEYIWLETRVDLGFDREIPGHGLLVTHEDLYYGDFEHNEVNRDPEHAYLKVIEADGDGTLTNNENGDDVSYRRRERRRYRRYSKRSGDRS